MQQQVDLINQSLRTTHQSSTLIPKALPAAPSPAHQRDLTVAVAPHPTPTNPPVPLCSRVREAFACSSPTSGTPLSHTTSSLHHTSRDSSLQARRVSVITPPHVIRHLSLRDSPHDFTPIVVASNTRASFEHHTQSAITLPSSWIPT